ncbi:MAG: type III-B CRISPR module RAMP protein Cmr1 [Phaeodactylibacter sp.]|nr:type III-B CRISPR module RAMP protein Cmr1 [Phaeodactylibacter sp.]MCB9052473.1 type III-B CRISPR module RAMP protein Cmr1 [Lewinellaceae bacterium]
MKTITFHCKVLSPLFLGGAYSEQAELRPPSIKGALRFWARAIAKHWIWEDEKENHKKLLQYDEELFGGVKMHQKKSLVSVEIRHGSLDSYTINGGSLNRFGEGLKYLLYSLAVHNKDKEGIKTEFPFDVTLRSKDQAALNKAIAAFWVLTYFGALGTRARRGAGAFEVVGCDGFELPGGISFRPGNNLASFLKDGLQTASKIFAVPPKARSPKGYSILGQKIWVSKKVHRDWDSALEEIGRLMFNYRQPKRPGPRYSDEEPRFTQQTLDQKAAFGLPVSVRNEKENTVNFKPDQKGDDSSYDRRASPLWISLAHSSSGIHWIVTELEGDFMDRQSSIFFKNKKGRQFTWPKEDDTALKEFLQLVGKYAMPVFQIKQ